MAAIVEEALVNVRKHSGAHRAWVRFERDGDCARIIVEDNGLGFDLAQLPADGDEHFGLRIMSERAESVGGSVELDPQVGRGTRVVIRMPIQLEK